MTGSSSTFGQRDEVVRPEEEVELGGVQALDRLVVDREVEDAEDVLGVLVDLRALTLREHVLDVERVPAEPLGELLGRVVVGPVEVEPGQVAAAELERAALSARVDRDRAGPGPPDAGQAGHTY